MIFFCPWFDDACMTVVARLRPKEGCDVAISGAGAVSLRLTENLGVYVGIHRFRHGVTTELLESGTPIHIVTRLMRHGHSKVTLEHYTRGWSRGARGLRTAVAEDRTPIGASFKRLSPLKQRRWRKRVRVELTTRLAKSRIAGFEGREGHRTPFASTLILQGL